ncbi:MAG: SAM-dependent methyltransferase [Spirochaetae bacterium HGW-Spirochaetae-5]|nr:MAG: SAM-dependent methyltransferase [Spirochaetae bacterium HGW-Spirochaetae-5]
MSVFGKNYSAYYDLLYKDKDYKVEVDYINEIITKYSKRSCKTILDIGCGTGKHLKCFKDSGFDVAGVDLSENMIAEAEILLEQAENLQCSKASEFNLNKKFDVIVSLFHVMSYQTENLELEMVFKNVYDHLEDGGLFIFDFWYGPAVLTDPPVVKIKRMENDNIKVTRLTEPFMNPNTNTIDVKFEVMIEDKISLTHDVIRETHKMRYLFLPEIEQCLSNNGLKFIDSFEWLKTNELSFSSWYGLVVACK